MSSMSVGSTGFISIHSSGKQDHLEIPTEVESAETFECIDLTPFAAREIFE